MSDGKINGWPRGPLGLWRALCWSLKGIGHAWRVEASFRLEIVLFVILAPLGLWLGQGGVEKTLLIGSLLLVLAAELLNSALEAVIERYGNEQHDLVARAKDMGSAAVFLLNINVLLCWGLLLAPRLLHSGLLTR